MKISRLFSILVVAVIFSNGAVSEAAVQVKAGAKCSKVGQISLVATKKFTCVKNGKNLVWDKGIAILAQPIFTANPSVNNYEWDVTVTNYQGRNDPTLEFSYSFAVNGGMWNLFSKSRYPKEKIVINQSFNLLEIKVAVEDSNNQYVTSPQFQRQFRVTVVPPQGTVANNSSSKAAAPSPATFVNLPGVQNQNLPTEYMNGKALASVFFRWAPQTNARAYVVRYQNKTTFTPKCDLTVALCEKDQLVDPEIHTIFIKDPNTTFVKVSDLATDSNYGFGFFYVISGGDLDGIANLDLPKVLNYSVITPTQGVPAAPEAIIVSGNSGNIKVSTSSNPRSGFKIAIYVIGGQFGSGKIVGYLEAIGEILVPAPAGTYMVTTMLISPSGVNGDPSGTITVTVK